jgi:ADP-ribosylglycohydrolase
MKLKEEQYMYGAILGDILGDVYEFHNLKTETPEDIDLFNPASDFTDDSVMTVAIADAILTDRNYERAARVWGRRYPWAGYGGGFARWLGSNNPKPYNSWGNGSAMRVSPVGWAFGTLEETLIEAENSAKFSHNHPEGIKGAQATAAAIFLARTGSTKPAIKTYIEESFGYNLSRSVAEIRPTYTFNESCQGTVPEALIVFLEAADFPATMRLAISIGGDSDTLACIAGSVAEAFYRKIPAELIDFANERLKADMRAVVQAFGERYIR